MELKDFFETSQFAENIEALDKKVNDSMSTFILVSAADADLHPVYDLTPF